MSRNPEARHKAVLYADSDVTNRSLETSRGQNQVGQQEVKEASEEESGSNRKQRLLEYLAFNLAEDEQPNINTTAQKSHYGQMIFKSKYIYEGNLMLTISFLLKQ